MNITQNPITLFSLTDGGKVIGQTLARHFPDAVLVHRAPTFQQSVRDAFHRRQPLVFICATGIVIRTLAPLLRDKYTDPPVVVIAERGRDVISLLGGHEAGADRLAREIATVLQANCVLTGATDYSRPVDIIGLGSDRGCPVAELETLFAQVQQQVPGLCPGGLASIDIKAREPSMLQLADNLALPLVTYPATRLRTVEHRLSARSEAVYREVGCYGVAEAAALVYAEELTGIPAELIMTKQKTRRATMAVARGYRQEAAA